MNQSYVDVPPEVPGGDSVAGSVSQTPVASGGQCAMSSSGNSTPQRQFSSVGTSFPGDQQMQVGTPPQAKFMSSTAGLTNWSDSSPKVESLNLDKSSAVDLSSSTASKLNRKESYKAQRQNYRREKKRVASELLNSLQDPAVIVLADWLKVRGTLKSWTKLWCVLKPGLLLLYKSPKTKSSHWVGTILLTSCQVIERPSKKDGFCFKLFHPLEQSIWAPRGPDKESMGAVVQPLPTAYLIFRAPSQGAGKCWMDALELSLRCSALLLRSTSTSSQNNTPDATATTPRISHETQWSEADYEKHFDDHDLDVDSQTDVQPIMSGPDSESDSDVADGPDLVEEETIETPYIHCAEDEFGAAGEQVEELADEHKSLIWFLVKQVRPGMDLSKVVLPTFILEPRSFLDKLSDSYYHADMLSRAVTEDDPFTRMKTVVQWYLSGFYKKPKGLKKPYNPILGETFRCYWEHPTGSRTFYIAEQVSHHPPVSAFYVTNRQDGFSISCSILAKSKFYGNSTSAILDGTASLTLLPRGEVYTLSSPYAHCKGILMGTLSMELGGKVNIECENTGYRAELEFKLKPFLGGSEYTNVVTGKLKLGKETLANINGHWDGAIKIKDVRTGEETVLFSPTAETRAKRLKRFAVPIEHQAPTESERLWQHVRAAIYRDDQVAATEEKTALEEAQRGAAKVRKATCTEWIPRLFQQDIVTGQWHYRFADLRPWDPRNDMRQFESDYKIQTKTRHQAPMVRTASIVSATEPFALMQTDSRQSLMKAKRPSRKVSMGSTPDPVEANSDSSQSVEADGRKFKYNNQSLDTVHKMLDEHSRKLNAIQLNLDKMAFAPPKPIHGGGAPFQLRGLNATTLFYILFGLLVHTLFMWLFLYKK